MNCSNSAELPQNDEGEIPARKQSRQRRDTLLGLLIKNFGILQKKSHHCKHDDGCLANIIVGSLRSFGIAFGFKSLFGVISTLMSKKKRGSPIQYVTAIFGEDSIRFALFPMFYTMINKGVLCTCRSLSNEDRKFYSFISGFIAGAFSLTALKQEKRGIWALYLLTRSVDSIFMSLQNRGHITKRGYYYIILLGLQKLVTGYAYGCESDELAEQMFKFYQRFGCEEKADVDFRHCWHEKVRLSLLQRGIQ